MSIIEPGSFSIINSQMPALKRQGFCAAISDEELPSWLLRYHMMQEPVMYTNLRQYPFSEFLRVIGNGRRPGRIIVERGGQWAEIYCDNGNILHIWRNGPLVPLGKRWLNGGLISFEALSLLAMRSNSDPTLWTDAQFAQIAVETGVLSYEQVLAWAMNDAVDLISILLTWRDGDCRFEEGIIPPEERLRIPINIFAILNAAVERNNAIQIITQPVSLVPITGVIEFNDPDPNDQNPVRVSLNEWKLLANVDGESTLEIIAQKMMDDSGTDIQMDPQRYHIEYQRIIDQVQRDATQLAQRHITVMKD